MTRINLVEPSELSDQHLIAEYREIFMIGSALQRSLKSSAWNVIKKKLPEDFNINKGHVMFFYDKGMYLHNRYLKIIQEMRSRGMKPDPNRKFKVQQWPVHLYNDWEPKNKDIEIVKIRIKQKIAEKPNWYRWSKVRPT